jgi:hypothetical protein
MSLHFRTGFIDAAECKAQQEHEIPKVKLGTGCGKSVTGLNERVT